MKTSMLAIIVLLVSLSTAQARPAGCPSLWCGCWLCMQLGYSASQCKDMGLNRARTWAVKFTRTNLAPGMIAVFARGRGGGGHVGKVVAVHGNSITMISGNDGNRVRTRPRSLRGLIAVVNPYTSYASSGATKISTKVVKISYKKQKRRYYASRYHKRAVPAPPSMQYAHAAG